MNKKTDYDKALDRQIKREEQKILKQKEYYEEQAKIYDSPSIQEQELFDPNELFNSEGGDNGSSVSKELFNPKNPKIKSDLTERQIKAIARLYEKSSKYYEPRGIYMLKGVLDQFVLLMISKDRKSRAEFVETHRETQKNKSIGLLDSMLGRGGGLQ